jgi:hypothetical protein
MLIVNVPVVIEQITLYSLEIFHALPATIDVKGEVVVSALLELFTVRTVKCGFPSIFDSMDC